MWTVPIKVRSDILGMIERLFKGMAPAKREREQTIKSPLEAPEPRKGRRDHESASVRAPTKDGAP
jgi:hypothetical protein